MSSVLSRHNYFGSAPAAPPLVRMNLKQLEVFYAIMNTGSVTAAARSLHVTQPAVSNVLKHMEQQLEFKLFERKGGRLFPTPEANHLLPDVNEI